ncbi:MAG: DUF177 domain-containing protein [Bacteroidaceae bacterium]|nr:DUF177 domain-containing protein [Bacteroidaceae bacterium]
MGKLDGYKVDLKGMATDTVSYQWQADNDFFSAVQGQEIKQGLLDVALRVKRTSGAYELEFQLKGEVEVTCDRCLEPMSQPIDAQCTLRVRMGDEYADDGDVVTIPEREGVINVAWNIYEFAALQIPLRHVHPDCPSLTSQEEKESDPRWEALRELVNVK